MHWLVRIAERADLNGDRPDVPPETVAQDAWPVVARAYRVADERLSFLVAQYFRLEVADFDGGDRDAVLLVPEASSRKHHVYPLYKSDRHLLIATCDPTDIEAERALGFSSGHTTVFQVASPHAIREALDARFSGGLSRRTLGIPRSRGPDSPRLSEPFPGLGSGHLI
jgi:hypothetical protein